MPDRTACLLLRDAVFDEIKAANDFYPSLRHKLESVKDKELVDTIISDEKEHLQILKEIAKSVGCKT